LGEEDLDCVRVWMRKRAKERNNGNERKADKKMTNGQRKNKRADKEGRGLSKRRGAIMGKELFTLRAKSPLARAPLVRWVGVRPA
jgi:hypothetical protein